MANLAADFAQVAGGCLPVDDVAWYAHWRQLSLDDKQMVHCGLLRMGGGIRRCKLHLLTQDLVIETRAYQGVDLAFPVFCAIGDAKDPALALQFFEAREVTWLD